MKSVVKQKSIFLTINNLTLKVVKYLNNKNRKCINELLMGINCTNPERYMQMYSRAKRSVVVNRPFDISPFCVFTTQLGESNARNFSIRLLATTPDDVQDCFILSFKMAISHNCYTTVPSYGWELLD